MKRNQENIKLCRSQSYLAVVVVVLTSVGCFTQIQWTLYTHRVQIDGLIKQFMKEHQPQSSGQAEAFLQRVKRSQNTQQFPGKNTKSTPSSQINIELIRNEVSKQLQHLLKTRICTNNKKLCIRGPRGRRGMRGRTGPQGRRGLPGRVGLRGPVGKHGPPGTSCKKCNVTHDDLKTMLDTLGSRGLPGLRGPPGPTSEKGEPGNDVSAASISIPPKSVVVNESDMVSLYCGAKGFPTPRVTWQNVNSSSPLSGSRHVVDVNGGLLIRNVKKSDQGTYKCTAKNIFPGEATAYATITVQDAAKIVQTPQASIISEKGQNVTFTCVAKGTPTPTITWSKVISSLPDGRYRISQEIVKSNDEGMSWKNKMSSSNLTLINLSLDDNGLYICKADNKLNSDTAMTQLTVVKPLYFTVIPPSKLEAVVGKTVQIDCQATNAEVQTWVQPTQDETNVNVFSNGSLVITMATKRNEGNYKCIAKNNYRQIFAVTYMNFIDSNACPQGWQTYKGSTSCYKMINKQSNWNDARKTCLFFGGDLVTIKSAEENSYVLRLARTVSNTGLLWIGLKRDSRKTFKWVDGSTLSYQYSNWNIGEPNSPDAEECGMMYVDKNSGSLWNNSVCSHTQSYFFMCEN